eukprot:16427725-Heterocapsa_arctica.AAC.1
MKGSLSTQAAAPVSRKQQSRLKHSSVSDVPAYHVPVPKCSLPRSVRQWSAGSPGNLARPGG